MLPRRFSFAVLVAVALLLSGCATGPKRHINACNAIATDAVENIECVQSRLRADPSTPMGVQARVDFLAVAAHSLRSRVRAGQITREQAQLTYSSLGRELDASPSYASTAYVSKQTLDILGLPTDTNAFSQYVQPAVEAARTFTNSAISKGGGARYRSGSVRHRNVRTSFCKGLLQKRRHICPPSYAFSTGYRTRAPMNSRGGCLRHVPTAL